MGVKRYVTAEVKSLSQHIRHEMSSCLPDAAGEISSMQKWIITYLSSVKDRDVFQRDVEKRFQLRRSTATGILQLMEKSGLLTREAVDYDARLKKLVLTEKARAIHAQVARAMMETEQRITESLTESELAQLFFLLDKMKHALHPAKVDRVPQV